MSRKMKELMQHYSPETVVYDSWVSKEKNAVVDAVRDQLNSLAEQEEAFVELEKGREQTPLTDEVRTLINEERVRLEKEYPEAQVSFSGAN